ncbi:MAG TPA: hypothetical protein VGC55_03640 [Dokdonella sp.]
MSEAYRRLTSALPERHAPGTGAFASEARALRAWVQALPMANFASAAKRLLEGLQQLNRQRVDAIQRLDALEILRPPAMLLAASTERQILGSTFPLPASKAGLADLALQFQRELALGYRIALVELCAPNGAVGFLRSKQVALAGARALLHGHEHLIKAYLLYQTPPSGAWQTLHDVHRFLTSVRLDERMVEDAAHAGGVSGRAIYVQALLLALVNPYRYTQREQGEVDAFVRTLAPHAELRSSGAGAGDVFVDVDADRGPGYLPEERVDEQRDVLALHVAAVIAFIEGQIAHLPPGARTASFRLRGGVSVPVDVDLARRIAAGLAARSERGHERLAGGYELDAVIGLHDLHYVLAGDEDFEDFMRRVRGQSISLSESDRRAAWRGGSGDSVRGTRQRARVVDQGLGGYRLLWERAGSGESVRVRVAELVGLALPEADPDVAPDWMVGVVRWIRIDDQGRVDAGVELLALRALAVGARAVGGADLRAAPLRGVLLAPLSLDPRAGYSGLLTSTEIDRAVTMIELSVPADTQGIPAPASVELVENLELAEATGVYQQFALAAAAEPAGTAAAVAAQDEQVDV